MFQRFFDEGLAQASFLVGCDRSRQAVVIDPRRDAAIYGAAAAQQGATIVAAIETHVHADFVSGARELAAIGARVITGPGSGVALAHHEVARRRAAVGRRRHAHVPAHARPHTGAHRGARGGAWAAWPPLSRAICCSSAPSAVRICSATSRPPQLARDLFASLQRVMALDDPIEVHPGHGAGSLCGAGIGKEPSSTIGRERRQNAMLQHTERAPFVAAVLADIPPTPPYFARMKRVNAEGPPLLASVRAAGPLPAIQARRGRGARRRWRRHHRSARRDGVRRRPSRRRLEHRLRLQDRVLGRVGRAAGRAGAAAVRRSCARGGSRDATAAASGSIGWKGRLPADTTAWLRRRFARCHDRPAARRRTARRAGPRSRSSSWTSARRTNGRAATSRDRSTSPSEKSTARAAELRREAVTAMMCEGGYRSALAASLLEREGFTHVVKRHRRDGGIPGIGSSGRRVIGGQAMKQQPLNDDVRSRLDAVIGSERPDMYPSW